MTPLCQTILDQYQVRKTKKQKTAFITLLHQHFPDLTIQKGPFPSCRNIIIGDVEKAQVLLTAHYDTCTQLPLPNFVVPTRPLLSIGYSVIILISIVSISHLLEILLAYYTANPLILHLFSLIIWLSLLILLIAGPANKHTANDNTSGVITLCELLGILTPEQRTKAAFVFFDHEESGLIGSSYFRAKYKKKIRDKLLINFDCVADGDHILVSANKGARNEHTALIKDSFRPSETKSILFTNAEKTFYPSDQIGFKKCVAIAALKQKKFLGYYLDRIHTSKDTAFDKKNIKMLCNGVLHMLKQLPAEKD